MLDDDSISLCPVSNTGILSNTREKDEKDSKVRLQLVTLIEKMYTCKR